MFATVTGPGWAKLKLKNQDQYIYLNINQIMAIDPQSQTVIVNGNCNYKVTTDSINTLIKALGFADKKQ